MSKIHIQFTLFSAFYSPLIVTMAGGFLGREGLEYDWSISPIGRSALDSLEDGNAQVVQSAPSQAFAAITRGDSNYPRHFAQINEMDGFYLTAREAEENFTWDKLEGAEVVMFDGGQPNAMLRYACHRAGVDFSRIKVITPGGPDAIDAAFRSGEGRYVQQQGPYPQQLEAEGQGHIVAQIGPLIGPCAFSSLAALPDWLASDEAAAFTRAYRAARNFIVGAPADEIASLVGTYFDHVDLAAQQSCIASYQALGCWTPHVEITPQALEVTLDVFEHAGLINQRYSWAQVCAAPPA